jgi:hypothetical protein
MLLIGTCGREGRDGSGENVKGEESVLGVATKVEKACWTLNP